MINFIQKISYLLLSLCLVTQAQALTVTNNSDTHLEKYSKFNTSSHESIDDYSEVDSHKHTHKHHEDGEEHEHEHEHSKISQSDLKLLTQSRIMESQKVETEKELIFFHKSLHSNFYPFDIFRPPIS